MKKQIVTLFIFLFFITTANAGVNNFQSGYIVTSHGDTIRGLINLASDSKNATVCVFKDSVNQTSKKYYPGEIASFRFDSGKYYVSKKVQINNLETPLFLEYLVKGVMSVYYYNDGDLAHYFFEKKDGSMEQVTKSPEKMEGRYMVQNLSYDRQLRALFSEYIPSEYESTAIPYDKKTIMKITEAYDNSVCEPGEHCIVYVNKKPSQDGVKANFELQAGFCLFQYKKRVVNNYTDVSEYGAYSSSLSPTIGCRLNISNQRFSDAFSFFLGLSFSSLSYKTQEILTDMEMEKTKMSFGYFDLGIKYSYAKYKFCPFVEVSGYVGYIFGKDVVLNNNTYYSPLSYNYSLRKRQIGWSLASGISYKLKNHHQTYVKFKYNKSLSDGSLESNGADLLIGQQFVIGYTF